MVFSFEKKGKVMSLLLNVIIYIYILNVNIGINKVCFDISYNFVIEFWEIWVFFVFLLILYVFDFGD